MKRKVEKRTVVMIELSLEFNFYYCVFGKQVELFSKYFILVQKQNIQKKIMLGGSGSWKYLLISINSLLTIKKKKSVILTELKDLWYNSLLLWSILLLLLLQKKTHTTKKATLNHEKKCLFQDYYGILYLDPCL